MSDSVRLQRRQPTRLPRPWDSPGKNTGVGCHFLLQCRKVKSESEVAQSCPTLRNPTDCSLLGFSIHGNFPGKSTGVGCHCLLQETPGITVTGKFHLGVQNEAGQRLNRVLPRECTGHSKHPLPTFVLTMYYLNTQFVFPLTL